MAVPEQISVPVTPFASFCFMLLSVIRYCPPSMTRSFMLQVGFLATVDPSAQHRTVLGNVKRMDQVLISLVQTSGAFDQRS